MKFGIFYELQLPRPWTPEGEFRLYQNALDQVEHADRLGYDFAWEVEHHFLEEYSHSPAPARRDQNRRVRPARDGVVIRGNLAQKPPIRRIVGIAVLGDPARPGM